MIPFKIVYIHFLASAICAANLAHASVLVSEGLKPGDVIPGSANAVKIRCFQEGTQHTLFALSLLNIDPSRKRLRKYDIALTTGHGFEDISPQALANCFGYGPSGKQYAVKNVKLSPNYKDGTATDWAVVKLERIKDKTVIRYNVDPELTFKDIEDLIAINPEVTFPEARSLLRSEQSCALYPRQIANMSRKGFESIFPHSCKAIAGQSGTPISVRDGDGAIMVGFHLGRTFVLKSDYLYSRPKWFGMMRIVDQDFVRSVNKIVLEMEQDR